MESKKLNKLTEEELYNIINNNPQLPSSTTQSSLSDSDLADLSQINNDALNFIVFFGLEAGNHLINTDLLYKLYINWSKKPIKAELFRNFMYLYLPKSNRVKHVFVNKNKINISKELYNYLNKGIRNINKNSDKKHFERFIKANYLKSGKIWIEFDVLYYLYDKWTFDNKLTPLLRGQLLGLCKMYFEHAIIYKKYDAFKLNQSIYAKITQKQMKEVLQGVQRKNEQKTKKTKKRNKTV